MQFHATIIFSLLFAAIGSQWAVLLGSFQAFPDMQSPKSKSTGKSLAQEISQKKGTAELPKKDVSQKMQTVE